MIQTQPKSGCCRGSIQNERANSPQAASGPEQGPGAPRASPTRTAPAVAETVDRPAELVVRVEFRYREAVPWAPAGAPAAFDEFTVVPAAPQAHDLEGIVLATG